MSDSEQEIEEVQPVKEDKRKLTSRENMAKARQAKIEQLRKLRELKSQYQSESESESSSSESSEEEKPRYVKIPVKKGGATVPVSKEKKMKKELDELKSAMLTLQKKQIEGSSKKKKPVKVQVQELEEEKPRRQPIIQPSRPKVFDIYEHLLNN